MKTTTILFTLLWLCTGAMAQVQCTEDVVISEGDTIEMCSDALMSVSGSAGFAAYDWSGPETVTGQTITPQFSGQYVLSAADGIGCISKDTIEVIIHPNPLDPILSTEGTTICPGSGTILYLQSGYVSYDWGAGTGPTYFVNTPGTYNVEVVDENGCIGNSSILISSYSFSVSSNQGANCPGDPVMLSASGGADYQWSTGEAGSQIAVEPAMFTQYYVVITAGTCSDTLYQDVAAVEPFDYALPDTIFLTVGETEYIEGPAGFTSYEWIPGGNVSNPLASTAKYTASTSEILTVVADNGGCTFTDSTFIYVIDLTIPEGFSPNGDAFNQYFVIPELNTLQGSLKVWNRWGDIVFEEEVYKNDWRGTCESKFCLGDGALPEGTYFYQVNVKGILFDGYVILKR